MTGVDYSDATPDVAYSYDRVGRITSVTDAGGTRIFAYNADGTLDAETFGTTAYLPGAAVARTYDSQGRNTGFQATSYGAGGTTYTIPAATYAYDSYGRLQSVASDSQTFAYAYGTSSPLLASVTFPNGLVTTWTYEATRNLVDHVENKVGGTTVSKYDYTNDAIGRRTNVQKSGTAFTATDTIAWGYDNSSQVTSAVAATDATYDYTYAYDPIGNRETYVTKETGAAVTTGYTSNQLNQYTAITGRTNPAYDDDGNMILMPDSVGDWTLTWDGENRLVSAQSATKRLDFVYDHMGRRIERRTYDGTPGDWTLSETRRFLYDGWHLIAEYTLQTVGEGTAPALVAAHLWGLDVSRTVGGAGGVGGLLRSRPYTIDAAGALVPGSRYYPTYNANGNVSEYLDSAGAIAAHHEYSPFGKLSSFSGVALPFRFSTKYLDIHTGLYYYGYRCYSPDLGRWISRDPAGEKGGINLMSFVWNSTLYWVDPLGLAGGHFSQEFGTADEAAKAALSAVATLSKGPPPREVCGYIYLDPECCKFYFTKPVRSLSAGSCTPHAIPSGNIQAGFYHTHPGGTNKMSGGDQSPVTYKGSPNGGRVWILPIPTQKGAQKGNVWVWQRLPLSDGSTVNLWKTRSLEVSWEKLPSSDYDEQGTIKDPSTAGLPTSIYTPGTTEIRLDVKNLPACRGKEKW